jgi:hypothetical protein
MTVDPATYTFAATRLTAGGWTYSGDIERLACLLQECCEEFEKELEHVADI